MYLKFSDFVSEIKPLSFFKKREQSKRFEHADVFQRDVVHTFVFKLWKNTKAFNQTPKAFLAKSFRLTMKELDLHTATTPYQYVTDWTFQKPESLFTEMGHIKTERCGPSLLMSEPWYGVEEIQCRHFAAPFFEGILNTFDDFLFERDQAHRTFLNGMWNIKSHLIATPMIWLKELDMFTSNETPTKEQSLQALDFVIKNRKNLLIQCESALNISEVTRRRYLSEDRKLAKSEQQLFIYLDSDNGLNRLERSALIYKNKITLISFLNGKLLREFKEYTDHNCQFVTKLNHYLQNLRNHIGALMFLQCVKRNTEKDKNKR